MGRQNRLYIGNIPSHSGDDAADTIKKQLQSLIHQRTGVAASDIELKNRHAFVTGPIQPQQLQGLKLLDGTKLTVQRANEKKKNFGTWAKPQAPHSAGEQQPSANRIKSPSSASDHDTSNKRPYHLTAGEVEDAIQPILAEEMDVVTDPIAALIASTAATTMALSAVELVDKETQHNRPESVEKSTTKDSSVNDFDALRKQSLSALLDDYGAQDTEWQKQAFDKPAPIATIDDRESRLGQLGKAPVHVNITSFGYRHGKPTSSYVVDCRKLEPLPNHLLWMDGQSQAVRGTLLRSHGDLARRTVESVAEKAYHMLHVAIVENGHGYASPAILTIYVGSDLGRHRSVVVAEMAGTALRKKLRVNEGNITVPVSVACSHRDIHSKTVEGGKSSKRRKGGDDDDDERV